MAFTMTAGNDRLTTALYDRLKDTLYKDPGMEGIAAACKLKIDLYQ